MATTTAIGTTQREAHCTPLTLFGTSPSRACSAQVQYKSIARVTYLPLPASSGTWADATRYAIVISLDDPLRQGNQRHPHLVLQLENREFEASIKIPGWCLADDVCVDSSQGPRF